MSLFLFSCGGMIWVKGGEIVIRINDSSAVQFAIDLAKTLCSNPHNGISLDASGANFLADFIETLENRLTSKETQTTGQ